jgi:hypothetical protein
MAAWRRRAMQQLRLELTGADLGACGRVVQVLDLETGFVELDPRVWNAGGFPSFVAGCTLEELLAVDQKWVRDRVVPLRSLRRLSILVDETGLKGVDRGAIVQDIQERLWREMPWVRADDLVVGLFGNEEEDGRGKMTGVGLSGLYKGAYLSWGEVWHLISYRA